MYLRIDEGFADHPKTLRFCRVMQNPEAAIYLIRLWTWACRSAPDGDLSGMDSYEIEIAVRYRMLDGKCYAAMVGAGFIDEFPNGQKAIHNWKQRTGGDIDAMASEAARKKRLRSHGGGKCGGVVAGCTLCLVNLSTGRPPDIRPSSSGDAADIPTQTRQEQASPGKASPALAPVPESPPIPARAMEPTAQPRTQPDSPANLIHVLGILVRAAHPEVGLWSAGRFSDRDAARFFDDVPPAGPERSEAVKQIAAKLEAYVASPSDDGWTLKGFLDRFNGLGRPQLGRAPPRDVRIGHVRAETETKHPVGYQKI